MEKSKVGGRRSKIEVEVGVGVEVEKRAEQKKQETKRSARINSRHERSRPIIINWQHRAMWASAASETQRVDRWRRRRQQRKTGRLADWQCSS